MVSADARQKWTELRVAGAEAGLRLDVFLARRFACSRSRVRLLAGQIFDGGGRALRLGEKVRAGELIRLLGPARSEPVIEVKYRLLFADDCLVAVDKAPLVPVHPAHGWRNNTLLGKLRADLNDPRLLPAHRLDRETSGVVIFGRGAEITSALMRQFASGRVRKLYLALVRGEPRFENTLVDLPLGRDPTFPIRCRMRVDRQAGREARTEIFVLRRGRQAALVAARPLTGRQHQIRVHLAELGHPLLGDKLYQFGGKYFLQMLQDRLDQEVLSQLGHHRQALCASRLELTHPREGRMMKFEVPLPEDLCGLCQRLGIETPVQFDLEEGGK